MDGAISWLYRAHAAIRSSLPRRHVLRATGVAVELLAIETRAEVHHLLVELPDGRRWLTTPDQIESRPAVPVFFIGACLGLVLAGVLVGLSVGLPVSGVLLVDFMAAQGDG